MNPNRTSRKKAEKVEKAETQKDVKEVKKGNHNDVYLCKKASLRSLKKQTNFRNKTWIVKSLQRSMLVLAMCCDTDCTCYREN